ncbi:Serine/threonine protein kinase [Giardia duodenalis assemblage B]|uniref:Serine/threonine protein kinase n=1 Tax=Giardia duodenalis assemblage B TaxID=1394984 RepID=A0A132NT94_GIAIN|nr:Serine/threonine protein kinase [Giardia intestinalis assemblage B]
MRSTGRAPNTHFETHLLSDGHNRASHSGPPGPAGEGPSSTALEATGGGANHPKQRLTREPPHPGPPDTIKAIRPPQHHQELVPTTPHRRLLPKSRLPAADEPPAQEPN